MFTVIYSGGQIIFFPGWGGRVPGISGYGRRIRFFNFSPKLSRHYHVIQWLNRNVVHTADCEANTIATVPLVFIAALFVCRSCANVYVMGLANSSKLMLDYLTCIHHHARLPLVVAIIL